MASGKVGAVCARRRFAVEAAVVPNWAYDWKNLNFAIHFSVRVVRKTRESPIWSAIFPIYFSTVSRNLAIDLSH